MLDLILTNIENHYCAPSCLAPLGKSDHTCILWKPNIKTTVNNVRRLTVRPFYPTRICNFGRWITSQNWEEVKTCTTTQEKIDAFYGLLDVAIDNYFPTKVVKIHNTDKPWITQHLRTLIDKRQAAYVKGDPIEWRKFRNIVKREVLNAKQIYHIERVRHLQHSDPHKWHAQVKAMTNTGNSTGLNLSIPGILSSDCRGIANAINEYLTSISANLPQLECCKLPAYLPSDKPVPQVQPWEVYNKLKKINPKKAGGPDSVPPRILREFSPELSEPLADILNSSFKDAGQSTTTKYLKYVDDLSFYENRSISQQGILQHDLNVFYDWCAENSLQLNAKKCKALQVCFAKNPPLIQPCFDDKPITVVDKTVILGVTLQNNLKWNTQVNNIVTKANRKLFMLRNLKKFGLDKQKLCAVYEGYIRPLLEYADVVWHPGLTQDLSNTIEAIQKRACHIILGRNFNSYEHAMGLCELDLLSERRVAHCLKFAKGLTSTSHSFDLVPPTRYQSHNRNLRNGNKITQFNTKTNRFFNSRIPYYIRLLNDS